MADAGVGQGGSSVGDGGRRGGGQGRLWQEERRDELGKGSSWPSGGHGRTEERDSGPLSRPEERSRRKRRVLGQGEWSAGGE